VTPADVVADARLWMATPYVHQARVRGVGTDCIGMIGGIARDRGDSAGLAWEVDHEAHAYGRVPSARMLLTMAARYLDQIDASEVGLGDVVLMKFAVDPQHFALVSRVDPVYIIHASSSAGRVVENRLDEKWRSRIVRAYRFRGL
jgi:NlpC/P60 family putative phage cell wall peptidase